MSCEEGLSARGFFSLEEAQGDLITLQPPERRWGPVCSTVPAVRGAEEMALGSDRHCHRLPRQVVESQPRRCLSCAWVWCWVMV